MARELESIFEQKMAQNLHPSQLTCKHIHLPLLNHLQLCLCPDLLLHPWPPFPSFPSSASQLIPGLDALEDDSEKILAINHQIQILQARNWIICSLTQQVRQFCINFRVQVSVTCCFSPAKPKKSLSVPVVLLPVLPRSSHPATLPCATWWNDLWEKRQLSEDVSNLPKKTWCASSKSFKNACQICIPTAIPTSSNWTLKPWTCGPYAPSIVHLGMPQPRQEAYQTPMRPKRA